MLELILFYDTVLSLLHVFYSIENKQMNRYILKSIVRFEVGKSQAYLIFFSVLRSIMYSVYSLCVRVYAPEHLSGGQHVLITSS